mmetsp:Transcript_17383/g.32995  ORF Transcript_17383/g.32995 Transcript_17383/m.32995 type:complete len:205 (-) Transcript_17383:117-731(-)
MFSSHQQQVPMIKFPKTFDLGFESDRSTMSPSPEDTVDGSKFLCETPWMTPQKMNLSPSFMFKPPFQPQDTQCSMVFAPLIPDLRFEDVNMESHHKRIGFKVLPRFATFADVILPGKNFCFSPIDTTVSCDEDEKEDSESASSSEEESDTVASLPCLEKMKLERAVRRKSLPKKKAFSGKPASPQRPPVRMPMIRRNSLGATAA